MRNNAGELGINVETHTEDLLSECSQDPAGPGFREAPDLVENTEEGA